MSDAAQTASPGHASLPPMAELQAQLQTSPDGLSGEDARHRLAQYGYN